MCTMEQSTMGKVENTVELFSTFLKSVKLDDNRFIISVQKFNN